MSQPYWSWGSDVLECDAPSVDPRVYKDLDVTGPEPILALESESNPVRVRHLANVGHKRPFYPSRLKFFSDFS